MIFRYPKRVIVFSVILMVVGVALPFLMTLGVIRSTLFLNFLSFGASVLGLLLGIAAIGIGWGHEIEKNRNRHKDDR